MHPGSRRASRGGWQRWVSRNIPTVVALLMMSWLVFVMTSGFRMGGAEDRRLQLTVRAIGKPPSNSEATAAAQKPPSNSEAAAAYVAHDDTRFSEGGAVIEGDLKRKDEAKEDEDEDDEEDDEEFEIEDEEKGDERVPEEDEDEFEDEDGEKGDGGDERVPGEDEDEEQDGGIQAHEDGDARDAGKHAGGVTNKMQGDSSKTRSGGSGAREGAAGKTSKRDRAAKFPSGVSVGNGRKPGRSKAPEKHEMPMEEAEDEEEDEMPMDEEDEEAPTSRSRKANKEGISEPRYKVQWDLQTYIQTVSDMEKFLKSDFHYPEDRMIVTHENFMTILHEKSMSARTGRALPKTYPYPRKREDGKIKQPFQTCALVGNSGVMQMQRFGHTIDKHDAVMRINQGPSYGYNPIVGARTTWRLLNKKWVTMYQTKLEGRGVLIPTESANATYLASRTGRGSFEKLAATAKRLRPDITTYWLSQGVQNRAYKLLAAFRNAVGKTHGTTYTGGDAPSSGLIALTFLLQVCDKVAVYGLSSDKVGSKGSRTWPYHYFHFAQHQELHLDSLQLRAHPHHSFEAEGDLIRFLGRGGRVKYCSDPTMPANEQKQCGWANADEL